MMASATATASSSKSGSWPVAVARSQPWTSSSLVHTDTASAPLMTVHGSVICSVSRSSLHALVASVMSSSIPVTTSSPSENPSVGHWSSGRPWPAAATRPMAMPTWSISSRTFMPVHGVGRPSWSASTPATMERNVAAAEANWGRGSLVIVAVVVSMA